MQTCHCKTKEGDNSFCEDFMKNIAGRMKKIEAKFTTP